MTQPPYGEPEQPQQYPGYQPPPPPSGSPYQQFPQPYPQQPYAYAPAPRNNTTRNVLITVAVVIVVLCGGGIAGLVAIVDNATDDYDSDYRGSATDPLTVTEGEEFTIRGFTYDSGWSLATDPDAESAVVGLSVTNDRDDKDSDRGSVVFTFLQGDTIVEQIDCYGAGDITYGRNTTLDCDGLYEALPAHDSIEVHATALFK